MPDSDYQLLHFFDHIKSNNNPINQIILMYQGFALLTI